MSNQSNRPSLDTIIKCSSILPGLMLKDLQSKYISMSSDFAHMVGFKNAEAAIGLGDYDLPCKAAKASDKFITCDQKVISDLTNVVSLDICYYATGWRALLDSKIPMHDEKGDVIGVLCHITDVSNTAMYKWYLELNYIDLRFKLDPDEPSLYILNHQHSPLPLSPQQEMCMFLLIRGKSMKEIADILKVSSRTIEKYVEHMKEKLGCSTKSQLIDLAISSGFIHYIPKTISQNTFMSSNSLGQFFCH